MIPLPAAFLATPIAHRALHDTDAGRPENSLPAVQAAIDAGFGIEVDIQPSSDGVPMVFHDYDLGRLTGEKGPISQRSADQLTQTALLGGGTIPTLATVLSTIDARVPLLIEVKDQDGAMGPNVGALENAIATSLQDYRGDVCVMSFNPHSVAALQNAAPDIPRGLITCAFKAKHWPLLPALRRAELADIPDLKRTGASFISHAASDLAMGRVADIKSQGLPVLCWTIRTPEEEASARQIADNVTFESYIPAQAPS